MLYSVPYQHYTNSIEQWFSVLKSNLRKEKDIGLTKIKDNIYKIPKSVYKNIFKGSYNRKKIFIPKKSRLKKLKIYK